MNDDFLYGLRKPPPARFSANLKARLDRQGPLDDPRKRRTKLVTVIALLLGGGAFALASPTVRQAVFACIAELRATDERLVSSRPPVPAAKAVTPRAVTPQATTPPTTSWVWGGPSRNSSAEPYAPPQRDRVEIISSSTLLPFTTLVGDRFVRTGPFEAPRVQSTGARDALRRFCRGVGLQQTDVAAVFRRMEPQELETCAKNRAGPIFEMKVGYEAVVLARKADVGALPLSRRDIYLAVAREIPDPAQPSQLIANPNVTWRQVNPKLPDERIEVVGPAQTFPVHQTFIRLMLEEGCLAFSGTRALQSTDPDRYARTCRTLRSDEAYSTAGDDDNSVLRRLTSRPNAVGIFSFNFVQQSTRRLVPSVLDGVPATYETLSTGTYGASRPLFIYVKRAQAVFVPELRRFIEAYASDEARGPNGYLVAQGLVPLSDAERFKSRADARVLREFQTTSTGP